MNRSIRETETIMSKEHVEQVFKWNE